MSRDTIYYYDRNDNLKLTFNAGVYFADTFGWNDWSWGFTEQFGNMTNFYRNRGTYSLGLTIASTTASEHDNICNIFTEDILAGQPGKIEIRGWSLKCYITAAEHDHGMGTWMPHGNNFTVQSIDSTWIRETTTTYSGISTDGTEDLGRDYSYEDSVLGRGYLSRSETTDALMDSYGETLVDSDGETLTTGTSTTDVNGYGYSVVSSYSSNITLPTSGNGYRVTFYGAVTNPVIYLDGNPVRVYVTVDAGEQLVVTSNGREKTIYLVSSTGVKTNAFVYRDKEYSPFFSIGKSTELTYGEVKFDFTTIESRSEPAWS